MQLELPFQKKMPPPEVLPLAVPIAVCFVKNPRARRYILRVRTDGSVRVTIPRGGTQIFARDFAERHTGWIKKQLQKNLRKIPRAWTHGTQILYRGQLATLTLDTAAARILLADQVIGLRQISSDFKSQIQLHFWRLAARELPPRTLELAALHQIPVRRVVVRNQRSRWGSCSAKATISLNWRLIQTPPEVRDYLILHELMHLRQMNHSKRFWDLVEQACPDYELAEKWLDQHNDLLR